jgi:hypothetical protein
MRQFSKWTLTAATIVVMIGAAAPTRADDTDADASTTQPTTRPDRRDRSWGMNDVREARQQRDRAGGFMQGRPNEGYRNEELPTDEEWQEIVEFMKVNSPVRLEMYDKLVTVFKSSANDRPLQGARRRIAGRYRDLMSMKERHAEMYEFALKQMVYEDQILGTMRELRDAPGSEPLQGKLREQVASYVDNFLNEREARLKRLREMCDKETAKIQEDRASKDQLIEKQSERFEKEMSRMIDFWDDPEKFIPQNPGNP